MLVSMLDSRSIRRLDEASQAARAAESRGEAGEAWRRHGLIRDASRDPDELLAEGVALSEITIEPPALGRMPR